METKVVSYGTGKKALRVVVGEETAIARMRHVRAKMAAVQASSSSTDEDENIMRIIFYPDAVSATIEYRGFDKPTFEEFIKLPGDFVDNWVAAVWELIPAWKNQSLPADQQVVEPDAEAEKKD